MPATRRAGGVSQSQHITSTFFFYFGIGRSHFSPARYGAFAAKRDATDTRVYGLASGVTDFPACTAIRASTTRAGGVDVIRHRLTFLGVVDDKATNQKTETTYSRFELGREHQAGKSNESVKATN